MMRREFLGLMAAFGIAAGISESESSSSLQELKLPPDVSAKLSGFAQGPLKQANWLKDLPLDGVSPCFVFTPK